MDAKVNSIPKMRRRSKRRRRRRRRRQRLAQPLIVEWTHKHTSFRLLLSKLKLLDNYCLIYLSILKGTLGTAKRVTYPTIQEKHTRFQVCVSRSCLGRIVIISAYLLFKSFRLIECQTLEKVSRLDSTRPDDTPPCRHTQRLSSFFSLDCLVIDKMLQVYTSV